MTQQPNEMIHALSYGAYAARCLQVVADMGVADHIDDEPVPVEKLAAACGADPGMLARVLRLLTAHGVFELRDAGYAHTDASRLLRDDHPMSARPLVRLTGLPVHLDGLARLQHTVTTGQPAVETFEPGGLWAYLHAHPEEAELFNHAMTSKAAADIPTVLDAYDFTPFASIADIGGGRGHLLRAVLDSAPATEGILFDRPVVIDTLGFPDQPRLTLRAGDFFDSVPPADAYVLMHVLHNWDDERAARILASIREAATAGATLLVIENVPDDERPTPAALTMDIIMLALTRGRERTAGELSVLLEGAGFRLTGMTETSGTMRIAEARAV
ncbi:methyltransferase [Streptomyces pseudovenezuelae]|uniref:C-methyltransferase n=1 Tax=Streptomyces pseudovenezuelae TaxID=67350 RepID=A0ABT6LPK0_9ACTN|nr:methyltransferase [Streptomyces pseudovenezuelae]MDH6217885.1 C-methyltransferase [Streptomyces pseudovenezuelae]